jgi:hypothetical protein
MFKNDLYSLNYIIIFIFKFFYDERYDYYIIIVMNKNLEIFFR